MQEIILYAILTLIIGGMLFVVLGRNVGHGADAPFDPADILKTDKPSNEGGAIAPVNFTGKHAEGLREIAKYDVGFNPDKFLDQAKMAYGMILDAYAEGDRDTLSELLNDEVRDNYFAAIDEREKKGLSQITDLARIISAEIVSVNVAGRFAKIRVLFKAEIATALSDENGDIVSGDPDLLARVNEIWSFERDLKSKSPAWALAGVEPHESSAKNDTPDHSPDS